MAKGKRQCGLSVPRVADPSGCLSGLCHLLYHLFLFCVGRKPGEFFGVRLVHSIVGVGQRA